MGIKNLISRYNLPILSRQGHRGGPAEVRRDGKEARDMRAFDASRVVAAVVGATASAAPATSVATARCGTCYPRTRGVLTPCTALSWAESGIRTHRLAAILTTVPAFPACGGEGGPGRCRCDLEWNRPGKRCLPPPLEGSSHRRSGPHRRRHPSPPQHRNSAHPDEVIIVLPVHTAPEQRRRHRAVPHAAPPSRAPAGQPRSHRPRRARARQRRTAPDPDSANDLDLGNYPHPLRWTRPSPSGDPHHDPHPALARHGRPPHRATRARTRERHRRDPDHRNGPAPDNEARAIARLRAAHHHHRWRRTCGPGTADPAHRHTRPARHLVRTLRHGPVRCASPQATRAFCPP